MSSQPQPTNVVVWATDDIFASGPDTGTPSKVAPSAARVAAGWRGNDPHPSSVENFISNARGRALEIIDSPAINWSDNVPNTGQPNDNHWSVAFSTVTVAPGILYSNVDAEVLCQFNSVKLFTSQDGRRWVDRGAHGLVTNQHGFAVGARTDAVGTLSIVGWEPVASGAVRATDNFGTAWYAAGNLTAGWSGIASVGGCFNGRFFICGISQLYYSDNLANVAWTRIPTSAFWTGAPPPDPRCFAVSPTECAIGILGTPGVIRSNSSLAWSPAAPLPAPAADGVIGLHWSVSHKLWIAITNTSRVLTAPEGFGAWTERAKVTDHNGGVQAPIAVCSLGRTIVMTAGNGLWASRDFAHWRRIPIWYTADGISPNTWQFLVQFNGRLWLGRHIQLAGKASLEYALSNVLPNVFTEQGDW